jgi:hypothetical protein
MDRPRRDLRHQNLPNGDREVTLEFETPFAITHMTFEVPRGGYPRNHIVTMDGANGELWQAVIAPGSRPIPLTELPMSWFNEIYLRRAARRKIRIEAAFAPLRPRRISRMADWADFLFVISPF